MLILIPQKQMLCQKQLAVSNTKSNRKIDNALEAI